MRFTGRDVNITCAVNYHACSTKHLVRWDVFNTEWTAEVGTHTLSEPF